MPQSYCDPAKDAFGRDTSIPDYKNNPNYNPNHTDWYPGENSKAYREGWDRIFGKKEKANVSQK